MGIRVVRGRGFDASDREGNPPSVVINEALAAKFFPGEDPIGRVLTTFRAAGGERIIGIVENVADGELTGGPAPSRYMLYDQMPAAIWHQVSFVLRTQSPDSVAPLFDGARSAIRQAGSQFAVNNTTTLQAGVRPVGRSGRADGRAAVAARRARIGAWSRRGLRRDLALRHAPLQGLRHLHRARAATGARRPAGGRTWRHARGDRECDRDRRGAGRHEGPLIRRCTGWTPPTHWRWPPLWRCSSPLACSRPSCPQTGEPDGPRARAAAVTGWR